MLDSSLTEFYGVHSKETAFKKRNIRISPSPETRGALLPDWCPPVLSEEQDYQGHFVRVQRLKRTHLPMLYEALSQAPEQDFLYMWYEPFQNYEDFCLWGEPKLCGPDPLFYYLESVSQPENNCVGICSYLNIKPEAGSIEIGHIHLAPEFQRKSEFAEALFLLAQNAFRLGFRRLEWKCDALNWRSRRAAERYGFQYEGIFRNAMVIKKRNRDTAWYAIIDSEWPQLAKAYKKWLNPANFDPQGKQKTRLSWLTQAARHALSQQGVQK